MAQIKNIYFIKCQWFNLHPMPIKFFYNTSKMKMNIFLISMKQDIYAYFNKKDNNKFNFNNL